MSEELQNNQEYGADPEKVIIVHNCESYLTRSTE